MRIGVADFGPGINRTMLPHIFEPFFTADDARGSGLGLAIAHELAERMDGDLVVESQPGRTIFSSSCRHEARGLRRSPLAGSALVGCGGSDTAGPRRTTTRVDDRQDRRGRRRGRRPSKIAFDPARIYEREGPGWSP